MWMEHLSWKEIDPNMLYRHVSAFRNHSHTGLQHRGILSSTKEK